MEDLEALSLDTMPGAPHEYDGKSKYDFLTVSVISMQRERSTIRRLGNIGLQKLVFVVGKAIRYSSFILMSKTGKLVVYSRRPIPNFQTRQKPPIRVSQCHGNSTTTEDAPN